MDLRWSLSAKALLSAAFCLAEAATSPDLSETSFQQGAHGYDGACDVELWAVAPNTCLEGNPNASTDANNDGGESQVLLQFGNLFGDEPGQVPPHATIHEALLIVSAFDEGTTVHLHRMLVPWRRSATWNSVIGGITADGTEASPQKDGFTFGKISATTSAIRFDVTDAVQAWAAGDPNHGWVFINTGGNGWDLYTCEQEVAEKRPRLEIRYSVPRARSARNHHDPVKEILE